MKIEAPCENKIIVDLTMQDMDELDITYEEMDYSNIETRRVIWTLLDKAGQALGRDIDPTGRMMIEAIPKLSGGCRLHFTILQEEVPQRPVPPKTNMKREELVYTYEFKTSGDLLDCAKAFISLHLPEVASALYHRDGQFRMILGMYERIPLLKSFFSEYARLCDGDRMAAAATREYWSLLSDRRALEQMGS